MSATKSMTDVAYDYMSKKKRAVSFEKLWQEVSKVTGISNEHIAQFYSDLSLDGRFVSLKDNKWDLRNHRKFAESQIDISEIEVEEDSGEVYDDDGNIIEEPEENY